MSKYSQFDFEVDSQRINERIWFNEGAPLVAKSILAISNVFIPYCKEKGFITNDLNEMHKSNLGETKSYNFCLYKHDYQDMEVFVHFTYTHAVLYILVDNKSAVVRERFKDKDNNWEYFVDFGNATDSEVDKQIEISEKLNNKMLYVINVYNEYSDNDYVTARNEAIDNILKHFDDCREKRYNSLMVWNSASVKRDSDKVTIKQTIGTKDKQVSGDWTRDLFDLSVDFQYLNESEI